MVHDVLSIECKTSPFPSAFHKSLWVQNIFCVQTMAFLYIFNSLCNCLTEAALTAVKSTYHGGKKKHVNNLLSHPHPNTNPIFVGHVTKKPISNLVLGVNWRYYYSLGVVVIQKLLTFCNISVITEYIYSEFVFTTQRAIHAIKGDNSKHIFYRIMPLGVYCFTGVHLSVCPSVCQKLKVKLNISLLLQNYPKIVLAWY